MWTRKCFRSHFWKMQSPLPHPRPLSLSGTLLGSQLLLHPPVLSSILCLHCALWNSPLVHLLGRMKPSFLVRTRLVLLAKAVPSSAGVPCPGSRHNTPGCPAPCVVLRGVRLQREKGNARHSVSRGRLGRVHRIQVLLNLRLPTKPPVQPQEPKSVVGEGYELTSLDVSEQGGWGAVLAPANHYPSTLLGKSLL